MRYEIMLRDSPNVPATFTIPRFKVILKRAQPYPTTDARLLEYARRRTDIMVVRKAHSSADPNERQAPLGHHDMATGIPNRPPEYDPYAGPPPASPPTKQEDFAPVDDEVFAGPAQETYMRLTTDAGPKGPKNEVLIAFAAHYGIDLGGATKKSDLVDAIEASLEEV